MENKRTNLVLSAVIVLLAIYAFFFAGSSSNEFYKKEYSGDVIAEVDGQDIREEEIRERLNIVTGGRGDSVDLSNIDDEGLKAIAKEVYVQDLVLQQAMESGIADEDDLKEKVSTLVSTIYKEKFLEKIAKAKINDEVVKTTYEELVAKAKNSRQYKASHILVKTEAEAKEAKKKITSGEASFQDIARLDSLDKLTAAKGGSLGFIFPEEFVPEFAEAVKSAKKNKLTDPVKTEFGWHIIKVEESKAAEIVTFEEAKPRIEKQLGNDAVREFIDELSKDLEIEIVNKPESKTTPATEEKAEGEVKTEAKPEDAAPTQKPE